MELPERLDIVRPQHRWGFDPAIWQARQRGANAFQALPITPLLDTREARLALPLPQVLVLDQTLESACELVDVPSGRRISVYAVLDEIGHTTDVASYYDGDARAHRLVHRKAPGFVFRGQYEYV